MNAPSVVHPPQDKLTAFGLGKLPPSEMQAIEDHLIQCDRCCASLKDVKGDSLVELARKAAALSSDLDPATDPAATRAAPAEAAKAAGRSSPKSMKDPHIPQELVDHPRYRVLGKIGAGGMGVVYKAQHRLMERVVALKVISLRHINHPVAVERFRQEVRAAARLSHSNIVAAYDADQADELHFLVMEFVSGVSLERLVNQRGALPVDTACHYIRQAASGLQHAFESGMVHRDVKPHNLMVTRSGQVKILDFGLARLARESASAETVDKASLAEQPTASGLTKTNSVLGTPDYMAPEQVDDARSADIRADIYSLGCTLYFLLAGRPPFDGASALEKLISHAKGAAKPLPSVRPDVPASLSAVVERMMATDPQDRYQTPAEVAKALRPFVQHLDESAQRPVAISERAAAEEDLVSLTDDDLLPEAATFVDESLADTRDEDDPLGIGPLAPSGLRTKRPKTAIDKAKEFCRENRRAIVVCAIGAALLAALLLLPLAWSEAPPVQTEPSRKPSTERIRPA